MSGLLGADGDRLLLGANPPMGNPIRLLNSSVIFSTLTSTLGWGDGLRDFCLLIIVAFFKNAGSPWLSSAATPSPPSPERAGSSDPATVIPF